MINIDLNKLKDENGYYSEPDAKALERLTGKSIKELEAEAEKKSTEIPDGKPSTWERETKLNFINEHGRDEFKRLVNERK